VTSSHDRSELKIAPDEASAFAGRLYRAVRAEVSAYAEMTDPELDRDFREVNRQNVLLFFRCLAQDRQPTQAELGVLEQSARRRLHQGVPLDAIFHSYRVGVRVMWECLLELASPRDLGRLGVLALEYADRVSTAAAQAYVEERQRIAQSRQEASRLLLTRVIRAEVDEQAAVGEASSLGFDLARPHAVMVAAGARGELRSQTSSDLVLAAVLPRLQDGVPGTVAALLSSGLVAAVPASDADAVEELIAAALEASGTRPGAFTVGVGTPGAGVRGLAGSYQEAVRARALGGILQPERMLHRYRSLALFDLFREGETMDAFVREALGPLLALDGERRKRMADTLAALFSNALSRKRTAFELGVHQNTLSHRIDRLEHLLGGSFSSGEFCFRVELALRLLPLTRFR
jgi:sugar diacid utilization regulator